MSTHTSPSTIWCEMDRATFRLQPIDRFLEPLAAEGFAFCVAEATDGGLVTVFRGPEGLTWIEYEGPLGNWRADAGADGRPADLPEEIRAHVV